MRDKGELRAIDDPDRIANMSYSEEDKIRLSHYRKHAIFGTSSSVAGRLSDLASAYDIEEMVILTWTYDQVDRMRSYELLAKAFALNN